MNELITYKGRTVPWVTRWSGEYVSRPVTLMAQTTRDTRTGDVATELRLVFEDDPYAVRDDHDFLWSVDATARAGEPEWRQVNSMRQQASMVRLRCQVCAARLPAEMTPWLLGRGEFDHLIANPESTTLTPPTCQSCWNIAARLCPWLRKTGSVRCIVDRREIWGVHGDVYQPDGTAMEDCRVSYGHRRATRLLTLAKQQAVCLHGLRELL